MCTKSSMVLMWLTVDVPVREAKCIIEQKILMSCLFQSAGLCSSKAIQRAQGPVSDMRLISICLDWLTSVSIQANNGPRDEILNVPKITVLIISSNCLWDDAAVCGWLLLTERWLSSFRCSGVLKLHVLFCFLHSFQSTSWKSFINYKMSEQNFSE